MTVMTENADTWITASAQRRPFKNSPFQAITTVINFDLSPLVFLHRFDAGERIEMRSGVSIS